MKIIQAKAFAKINLSLDIVGKRRDGYHEVEMVMQSISLHDELWFSPFSRLILETSDPALPVDESNLVLRAAKMLQELLGVDYGAKIVLNKKIPVGAGLGGGSADAAATLIGLNDLWGGGLPLEILQDIAIHLGADVPFCLRGGTALARGMGEKLTFLPPQPQVRVVLLKPPFSVSTAWVYRNFRFQQKMVRPGTTKIVTALQQREPLTISNWWANLLENVTFEFYPELKKVWERIGESGFPVRMSGSGPTLFVLISPANEEKESLLKQVIEKTGWWSCEACFVHSGVDINRLHKGE